MLGYIPLIVIVLGLAIMAIIMLRKKTTGHAAREKAVKEAGWEYEKRSSAYAIGDDPETAALSFIVKGEVEDVPWEIQASLFLSINNTTYQPNSVFRCKKQLIGDNYFIATPDFLLNSNSGEKKDYLSYLPKINAENILEKFKIDPGLLKNLKLYQSGNDYFNKNYYLYASDPDIVKIITGKDTGYYLVSFAQKAKDLRKMPSLLITPQFLEIKLLWTLEKAEDIKAFADFGIALIKNI
jgi:hypothetical protein